MPNSDRKGKQGEREFCQKLREHGFGAIRSQQNAGVKTDDNTADVITSLDTLVRWEVKRGYNDTKVWGAEFLGWQEKLLSETPNDKEAILAWRPDFSGWTYFIMEQDHAVLVQALDDLMTVLKRRNFAEMDTEYDLFRGQFEVSDPQDWRSTGKFR